MKNSKGSAAKSPVRNARASRAQPVPFMSRFYWHVVISVTICIIALWLHKTPLLIGCLIASFLIICLGVLLPRLSVFGPFTCRGKKSQRAVALTFDDGPDARSTPALLEVLREAGVPAAFFAIGKRVAAEPALANRILREGHLLENHSFAHSNMTNFFTTPRLRADLTQAQATIEEVTGHAPTLYRPPMGLSNPNLFRVTPRLGLKVVGWTARGFDTRVSDPEWIVSRIVRQLKPGAIILLHDGNIPVDRLVVTIKLLLAKLRERNYEVVRLDTLLE